MFFVLADANTSAGAPCTICCAKPELGPKLNTILTPGWADSNCLPRVVNASVRDAAAKTFTVSAASDEPAEGLLGDDPPHAVTTATRPARPSTAPPSGRRVTDCSRKL